MASSVANRGSTVGLRCTRLIEKSGPDRVSDWITIVDGVDLAPLGPATTGNSTSTRGCDGYRSPPGAVPLDEHLRAEGDRQHERDRGWRGGELCSNGSGDT